MVFIETSVFTRQIRDLISDDRFGALQEWIAASPTTGELVKLELRWIEDGRKTV